MHSAGMNWKSPSANLNQWVLLRFNKTLFMNKEIWISYHLLCHKTLSFWLFSPNQLNRYKSFLAPRPCENKQQARFGPQAMVCWSLIKKIERKLKQRQLERDVNHVLFFLPFSPCIYFHLKVISIIPFPIIWTHAVQLRNLVQISMFNKPRGLGQLT